MAGGEKVLRENVLSVTERSRAMKISTLRENITGSEKNCRNKYVHETRSGNYYLDSGIGFIQGECVFEGTPSYDEHLMYGCTAMNRKPQKKAK